MRFGSVAVRYRMAKPPLVLAFALAMAACGSKEPAKDAADCTKKGVKTGVEGAKTGVKTGVEGVKTFGRAVGGYVEGGSDEASREWRKGKVETKRTAREGAADTEREANAPECP
jgi:hypothetical protein